MSTGWGRSDWMALIAIVISGGGLIVQYQARQDPFLLQSYINKTESSGNIIQATEQLINTRQTAMVQVSWNWYDSYWAKQAPTEALVADAKTASPILASLGNLQAVLQNNVRFWHEDETKSSLKALEQAASESVKCFSDLASAGHKLTDVAAASYKDMVASTCEGQNIPGSLDALKRAEGRAMAAMDHERSSKNKEIFPSRS